MGGRWEQWEATWNHRAQVGALGNKSELQGVRWKPQRENRWEPWETKWESQRTGRGAGAGSTVRVTHSYGSQVPRIC